MNEAARSEPLVSAVILCFNAARYIENCVTQLIAALAAFEGPGEVIVVENGSADGSRERIEQLAARYPATVKPIYSDINLGTTVSRNRALAVARGRYLLVLDADALIDARAMKTLRNTLDRDPGIGLVAPQLRYPDGRFQLSADEFPTMGRKLQRWFRLRTIERDAVVPDTPTDIDYAISACWLMRREVQREVGLFDEHIFYSPEDVDYCIRVWLAGYRVVYQPAAVAIHDAQELSRFAKLGRHTLRHVAGLLYLFRKYRYCIRRASLIQRFPH